MCARARAFTVEKLQALVNGSLGGVIASIQEGPTGPVCLPRRAETFGGFDSHQMHSSKSKCVCVLKRTITKLHIRNNGSCAADISYGSAVCLDCKCAVMLVGAQPMI